MADCQRLSLRKAPSLGILGSDSTSTRLMASKSIATLPSTTLIRLFSEEYIDFDDLLALRLTCRALSVAATAILFHRILISPLCHDRDVFFAICQRPHLAQHVCKVEWQEVSWGPGYMAPSTDLSEEEEDIAGEICSHLNTELENLFWLPSLPLTGDESSRQAIIAKRQEACAQFQDVFQSALSQLSNLTTVISNPMRSDRILDTGSYPIDVALLRAQEPSNRQDLGNPVRQGNDGLFLFLLPAIARSNSIHRLLWDDELALSSYLHPAIPEAFTRLDTLDISISPRSETDSHGNLAVNINAASNVRHLSLSMERSGADNTYEDFQRTLLKYSIEYGSSQWSNLHTLSIAGMDFTRVALPSIIRFSAGTLRHVYLRNCNIPLAMIRELGDIPGLGLRTFCVQQDEQCYEIVESALLRYLHKHPPLNADDTKITNILNRGTSDIFKTVLATPQVGVGPRHYDEYNPSGWEENSLLSPELHRYTCPKWKFKRLYSESDSRVMCYQVPESEAWGFPTKIWRFHHRSGAIALGDDPLEYFEDWDSEAGDYEVPTPYCLDLSMFVTGDLEGYDEDSEMVAEVDLPAAQDAEMHDGAFEYDASEDPILQGF